MSAPAPAATRVGWLPAVRAGDAALLSVVVIAGSVTRHAVYTTVGVAILVLAVLALAGAVRHGLGPPSPLGVLLAVGLAGLAQVLKPPYMNVDGRTWALRGGVYLCLAGTGLAGALLLPRLAGRQRVALTGAGLAAVAGSYLLVIRGSARPLIDVWAILQGASLGVVHGHNPYEMVFANVPPGQVDNCFNYLPATFLVGVPTRLLFGDVRYAEAAVLGAGVVALAWWTLRATGRPAPAAAGQPDRGRRPAEHRGPAGGEGGPAGGESRPAGGESGPAGGEGEPAGGWPQRAGVAPALAVLLGVLPGALYDTQQAWNETILAGALVTGAVLLAAGRSGAAWAAVACLALALCTKQHVVLLLPLWALWPAFGVRRAVAAAAGAAAVGLPWVLADFSRFKHCVLDFFVDLPARPDSLSIWHLLPGPLATPAVLALTAGAYALALRRLPRTPGGLLVGCGLVLAGFDLANKQSFLNQWLLVAQLVVAGLALLAADRPAATGRPVTAGTPSNT
ncbi:MAG TPA: hypothetical protein VMU51_06645 [Mycobacteriales bacterium]|nr:hypothetical protein [Mycobacteriales bacterium]